MSRNNSYSKGSRGRDRRANDERQNPSGDNQHGGGGGGGEDPYVHRYPAEHQAHHHREPDRSPAARPHQHYNDPNNGGSAQLPPHIRTNNNYAGGGGRGRGRGGNQNEGRGGGGRGRGAPANFFPAPGRSCRNCGQEGHFARDCTNAPGSGSPANNASPVSGGYGRGGGGRGGGDPRACFKCGQPGHLSRECPNQPAGGAPGGGGTGGRGGINPDRKKYFDSLVKSFVESDDMTELEFPSTLLPIERHHVHKLAMHYSLDHKSSGPSTARVLKLTKLTGLVKAQRKENANQVETVIGEDGKEIVQRVKTLDGFQGVQPLNDEYLQTHANELMEKTTPIMENMVGIMEKFLQQPAPKRHFAQNKKSGKPAPHPPKDGAATREKLWTFRQTLPAYKQKDTLLNMVRNNKVVIVSGDTGCGKTTQIPQLLMDSDILPKDQHIVCTQPRRISALSVANRVAEERGESCGASTGYVIRFENATSRDTRLMYVTTGILLRRLHTDPELKDVGIIVLDEVHERDVDTDFSLLLLRDLLRKKSHLRIVVMSATIQIDRLVHYFQSVNTNGNPPPLLSIPGTLFPVKELWLEDVQRWLRLPTNENGTSTLEIEQQQGGGGTNAAPSAENINIEGEMTQDFDAINKMAKEKIQSDAEAVVPYNILVKVIEKYHAENRHNLKGAILVFLPGWGPIDKTMTLLRQSRFSREYSILPLHSSLTSAEQARVFYPAPRNFRKIVLSTNVAETSITIDDITCVIDSGLQKGTSYEPNGNTSSLTSQLIAKANGLQRRGRAGRVQAGTCVHLLPRAVYENLPDFLPPEIVRSPLEEICLQIKAVIPNEKCADVLGRALDAPDAASIPHAVDFLTELGAFDPREKMTNLGRVLAMLPIHPVLGKMLLFAATLGVLEPVAIIAAGLSSKSPFVKPMPHEVKDAREAMMQFDAGRMSDHLAVLTLHSGWKASQRPADYARSQYADHYTLRGIERTKEQLMRLIIGSGYLKHCPTTPTEYASRHLNNHALIRFVLLWSLYPRVGCFEFSKKGTKTDLFCWDNKPATCSMGSVGGKIRRRDVPQREFIVYFERMKIESQLNVFDMSAVSRTAMILAVRELQVRSFLHYPHALIVDDESKFQQWERLNIMRMHTAARGETVEITEEEREMEDAAARADGAASPSSTQPLETRYTKHNGVDVKELSILELDYGKKNFLTGPQEATALQTLREVMQFYFAYSVQRVDASMFPEELVEALSISLGLPTSQEKPPTNRAEEAAAAAALAQGGAASAQPGIGGGAQPGWTKNHSDEDEESHEDDDDGTMMILEDEELTEDAFERQMNLGADAIAEAASKAAVDTVLAATVVKNTAAVDRIYDGFGDLQWLRRHQREVQEKETKDATPAAAGGNTVPAAANMVAVDEEDDDEDDVVVFNANSQGDLLE